jgi:Flp pilus assembly secretin CpaC
VDKGSWFFSRDSFVFILLVASGSSSAGYANDLCNGQQVYGVSARRPGQTSLRSQPAVADVVVVAPSQLLINGKAVGTTSLIVFTEKGDVSNYDLIVLPDVAALRGEFRLLLPNEKVEVGTSGPSLVLKGEVSNEVVYDKVLEMAMTYLRQTPAAVAPSTTTSVRGEEFKIVRISPGLELPAEGRSPLTRSFHA